MSDEDLRWIAPGTSEDVTAAAWSQHTNFVVMTRGAEGASVFVDGHLAFNIPGVPTVVVDTVGAGDTFMAWLIRGVLTALETLSLSQARPPLGVSRQQGSGGAAEHKSAFRAYMQSGESLGLKSLEGKALSAGSGPDGGYLVPAKLKASCCAAWRPFRRSAPWRRYEPYRAGH